MTTRTLQERKSGLARLAGWCYLHRRIVLVVWLLLVIALIGGASSLGSSFSNSYASSSLPAQRAQNLLTSRFPGQSGATVDVVLQSTQPLTGSQVAKTVNSLVAALQPLPDVTAVTSPLAPGAQHQVSANGRIGFAIVTFDKTSATLPDSSAQDVITTAKRFAGPGLSVAVGGQPADNVVTAAPGGSEGIGVTAAIVIMLLAFGSVVAMGLPILTALVGVGMGFGIVALISHLLIDPDLRAGTDGHDRPRRRDRLRPVHRHPLPPGTRRAAASPATRSSLPCPPRDGPSCSPVRTVIISLLGLFLVGQQFLDGLAVGTILAVLAVMAAALTLLPAMLGFSGRAIDRLHLPGLLQSRRTGHDTGVLVALEPHRAAPSRPVRVRPPLAVLVAAGAPVVLHAPGLQRRGQRPHRTSPPARPTT